MPIGEDAEETHLEKVIKLSLLNSSESLWELEPLTLQWYSMTI